VNAKLLSLVGLYAAVAMPCGGSGGLRIGGTPDLGDARAMAAKSEEVNKKKAQCDKLKTLQTAWEEERAIGGAVAVHFISKSRGAFVDNKSDDAKALQASGTVEYDKASERNKLNAYVNKVGKNLAGYTNRPNIPWTFGVIDADEVNAFSAPGGYILVTTGLLKTVDNEAQLAAVLGHEISHVIERHGLKAYGQMKTDECRSAVTSGVVADAAGSMIQLDFGLSSPIGYVDLDGMAKQAAGEQLKKVVAFMGKGVAAVTGAGYSQSDEFIADVGSMKLMQQAGYEPKELAKVIAKLPEGGGLMANHASNADRIAKSNEAARNIAPSKEEFGPAEYKSPPLGAETKVVKK
jgi:beta-barrel assembly-enhancing protease